MTYVRRWRIAGLLGLVAAAVLAVLAVPAGGTQVCPPGTTNPAYCSNVPPIAVTAGFDQTGPTSFTIQGVAGPGVPNGDLTRYHFEFGTSTNYGSRTRTGTVGSCPPGTTNPAYCNCSTSGVRRGASVAA